MALIPRSLYRKIAFLFFFLILLFAFLQYLILQILYGRSYYEQLQRGNWGLAEALAADVRPVLERFSLEDDEVMVSLHEKMMRMQERHPGMDFYLLDRDGRPMICLGHGPSFVCGFQEKGRAPLGPIREFLAPTLNRRLPLYGRDPSTSDDDNIIFSVAPVSLAGEPGYFYAVITGRRHRADAELMANDYLLLGGVLTSGILVLIIGGIGAALFYLVTQRFNVLVATVNKIAGGALHERVPSGGTDEIAALAEQINQMADTIVQNIEALQQTDALRRELVANVSHELGAPLSSLEGYLAIALNENRESLPQHVQSCLEIALRNVQALTKLSRELLDLAKLEAKDIQPVLEPMSVLDLVTEEIVPRLQASAAAREIELRVKHPDELPLVMADFGLIERVLINLVENGIRYGRDGGSVEIELHPRGALVAISVRDDGIGIAADDLRQVFERFYRTSEAREKVKNGTGLGLAIVRRIVEAHQQEIRVESELGRGTTFRFSLPQWQGHSHDGDAAPHGHA